MKHVAPDELIDSKKLNPNDPKVYTDPTLFAMLDPVQQVIAMVNMAQTGQLVQGNPTLTLEAMLEGAGYPMKLDGQLSADEMVSLENYKAKLNDEGFKETAKELMTDFISIGELGKPQLSIMAELFAPLAQIIEPEKTVTRGRTFQQGGFVNKLISDPD